jgi:hypothetical protein
MHQCADDPGASESRLRTQPHAPVRQVVPALDQPAGGDVIRIRLLNLPAAKQDRVLLPGCRTPGATARAIRRTS